MNSYDLTKALTFTLPSPPTTSAKGLQTAENEAVIAAAAKDRTFTVAKGAPLGATIVLRVPSDNPNGSAIRAPSFGDVDNIGRAWTHSVIGILKRLSIAPKARTADFSAYEILKTSDPEENIRGRIISRLTPLPQTVSSLDALSLPSHVDELLAHESASLQPPNFRELPPGSSHELNLFIPGQLDGNKEHRRKYRDNLLGLWSKVAAQTGFPDITHNDRLYLTLAVVHDGKQIGDSNVLCRYGTNKKSLLGSTAKPFIDIFSAGTKGRDTNDYPVPNDDIFVGATFRSFENFTNTKQQLPAGIYLGVRIVKHVEDLKPPHNFGRWILDCLKNSHEAAPETTWQHHIEDGADGGSRPFSGKSKWKLGGFFSLSRLATA